MPSENSSEFSVHGLAIALRLAEAGKRMIPKKDVDDSAKKPESGKCSDGVRSICFEDPMSHPDVFDLL